MRWNGKVKASPLNHANAVSGNPLQAIRRVPFLQMESKKKLAKDTTELSKVSVIYKTFAQR
jgi:hypothetical protein